ncbi:hypothetical protein Scep_022964 [Stephania cephalantha]|uniref:Uncharacterized protein n=1 Tax=Stephania cephalantha TaxID=152367 RepID=A0AAP0F6F0_9MAGN
MELVKNKLEFGNNWKATNSLKELAQLYQNPNSSPIHKIDTKIVDLFDKMNLEPKLQFFEIAPSDS